MASYAGVLLKSMRSVSKKGTHKSVKNSFKISPKIYISDRSAVPSKSYCIVLPRIMLECCKLEGFLIYYYLKLSVFSPFYGVYCMTIKTRLPVADVLCVLYFSNLYCIVRFRTGYTKTWFLVLILFCVVKGRHIELYYQEAGRYVMGGSLVYQFQFGFKQVGNIVKEESNLVPCPVLVCGNLVNDMHHFPL